MDTPRLSSFIEGELPRLVDIRRDLHQHPELGYCEHRTSAVVQRELTDIGIPYVAGVAGGTGVVAHLPATSDTAQHAVALRADMDALPIQEHTGLPYASKTPGIMHACGHDGHTAMLIGAARVLAQLQHRPNPVTFVFQPAEEGGAGGQKMTQEGVLDGAIIGPTVERIFGIHGWPLLPLGHIGTRPGPLLSAVDTFSVVIQGTGSHAAHPEISRDPVLAAAHCVIALQSIISRNVNPVDKAVLSVTGIQTGSTHNVIPDTATFIGTVRTQVESTRSMMQDRFHTIVRHTSQAMGCEAKIQWCRGYPITMNCPLLADQVLRVASENLGESFAELLPEPSMGGEDFAYYAEQKPACFFVIGLRPPGADHMPMLHQSDFDFNDDALHTGVEMHCRMALSPSANA